MHKKAKCFLWGIVFICFLYGFLINHYRKYIYVNHISDLGFADIGNNISIIPGTYFFVYLIRLKFFFSKYQDIIYQFLALSTVEFLSAFVPHIGTFDFKDILGLILGALLTWLIVAKGRFLLN